MDDDQRNTLATLLKSFICSHAKYKIIALILLRFRLRYSFENRFDN